MTSESGRGQLPDEPRSESGSPRSQGSQGIPTVPGVPGRTDVALTLQQQPAGDVRGPFGRIFGANPLAPAARGAFDRATGARRVARLLDGLGDEWLVLHSVPLGGTAADAGHVVVGPSGVLVVTSAHHRVKNVFVAGQEAFVDREKTNLIPLAEDSADVVARALRATSGVETAVTPVIVFVDPKRLVMREKPKRTRVFADLFLRRKLRRLPTVLSGEDLAAAQRAAAADTTWPAPQTVVTPEQLSRFEELDRSATTARRLRSLWRWTSAVVVLSAVLLVVQGFALGILG